MPITDINFPKLLRQLLPGVLRKSRLLSLVNASTVYVTNATYQKFKNWEVKSWYDIKYSSGQVAFLEYVLNDKFDPIQKRIFISGGLYPLPIYIYTEAEQQPLYIYTENENQPIYLYTENEYLYGFADFVINVPNGLPNEETTLRGVADRYKRDSKNYLIKYF